MTFHKYLPAFYRRHHLALLTWRSISDTFLFEGTVLFQLLF